MPLTKRASDKFKPFKHCTQENKLGLLSHLGCVMKTPLSLREQATLSLTGPVTGAATARHFCITLLSKRQLSDWEPSTAASTYWLQLFTYPAYESSP